MRSDTQSRYQTSLAADIREFGNAEAGVVGMNLVLVLAADDREGSAPT
jgi:hypothetical protein